MTDIDTDIFDTPDALGVDQTCGPDQSEDDEDEDDTDTE